MALHDEAVVQNAQPRAEHPLRWVVGAEPSGLRLYIYLWLAVGGFLVTYHLITVYSEVARIILPTFPEMGEDLGQIVLGIGAQTAAEAGYIITEPVSFGGHLLASFTRWGTGMFIGTAVGFPAAIWLALSPIGARFTERLFPFFYAIPRVALTFLVLAVVGYTLHGQITAIAIGAFLSQIVMVFYGCLVLLYGSRTTDASRVVLIDRAVLSGTTRRQLFWYILVPWSLPSFFQGIRIGSVSAFGKLILAESISTEGIGHLAYSAYSNGDKPRLFAMTLVFMLVTYLFWRLLDVAQRRLLRWQQ